MWVTFQLIVSLVKKGKHAIVALSRLDVDYKLFPLKVVCTIFFSRCHGVVMNFIHSSLLFSHNPKLSLIALSINLENPSLQQTEQFIKDLCYENAHLDYACFSYLWCLDNEKYFSKRMWKKGHYFSWLKRSQLHFIFVKCVKFWREQERHSKVFVQMWWFRWRRWLNSLLLWKYFQINNRYKDTK